MKFLKNSFTLPEIIVVLVIIGIGIALFYSLFFLNWLSYEIELTKIELHQQLDEIFEQLHRDVLPASALTLADEFSPGQFHSFTISYPGFLGRGNITYLINGNQLQRGGVSLSENLDSANSFFQREGGSLLVNLVLTQNVIGGKTITFSDSQQLLPRN